MKKVIILGAGITGLSAAFQMSKNNFDITVLEKEQIVGGLAKTIKFKNNYVDIGPHSFFSEDKEVYDFVKSLFKEDNQNIPKVKRSVKMYFLGRYVDYPLSAKSILFQMGPLVPVLSFLSFAKSFLRTLFLKKKKINNLTIKEWAIDNFGYYLYKNFFKPYTEQFWKIKTEDLSHRVIPASKKLDFARTLKHLLISKYLEISKREPGSLDLVQRESLPTFYPKKGFGEISDRISRKILANNVKIELNTNINKVIFNKNNFEVYANNNQRFDCDILISTLPINYLAKVSEPLNQNKVFLQNSKNLQYLGLIMLYIVIKKKNILGCQYCYFLNRPYNRISNLNSFSDELSEKNTNIISLEISCHSTDTIWAAKDNEIFNECKKNLIEDKLLKEDDIIEWKIIKVPNVYPIYKKNYEKNLEYVFEEFKKIKNFHSIGRLGQFYYGDIDQMIRCGFDLSDKIIK